MAVEFDKIKSSISNSVKGYKLKRYAHVTGVTGAADARLYNAMIDAQMPSIGDSHPVIPDIALQSMNAEVIDNETVVVTLDYYKDTAINAGGANAKVSISASTASEDIVKDLNGDPFVTQYNGTKDNGAPGIVTGNIWPNVTVDRPRLNIDFEYTASSVPTSDISTYLGTINNGAWNGYAAETMLCTAINVNEKGDDYQVRYSFAYNADGWGFIGQVFGAELPLLVHPTNPDASLDLATGQRPFDIYSTSNFSALGFVI